MTRAMMDPTDELVALHGLRLGTLAYRGTPTQGSVIVYSSVHARWGRVPMPEVTPLKYQDALLHLWGRHPVARWVAVALGGVVACLVCGIFGFAQG